ncbi:cytochrome-c oxidase, cbb3-type subunit III [Novosphingobium sp. ES2-1]|jgi:cytochrome c oxidase cbb3-type subunit III|uniref:cytochrome-c oxidase, cbb3-type subunit III n=1 Tax=Novosphingobium sp. ES2-1 TaxID=2780074 RepID=UPI00187F40B2|nr:cytochrome-c oxidase, cbb3-type subunit III [Novosphingobium sp. ES2-1]QOV94845.1 cytochrome-c oxidase, cbb3-type subunit III [Novosphingobium sp. ES2-1]
MSESNKIPASAGGRIDDATGVETVGHEWDGIEELNNPLPRWWLWSFYATIVFSIAYCVVYPAWPMIDKATAGTFGWTSRGQLDQEMKAEAARKAGLLAELDKASIEQIAADPRLRRAAIDGGRAAFKVNCIQCHGNGAAGSAGYPNLNDDDWLWGGDVATVHQTLVHGVRQPGDDATRMSQMPAFGRDGILTPAQVQDVVSHVRVISAQEKPSGSSQRGAEIYAANCVACHGASGEGDRAFGAPKLSDAIWLYGGDRKALTQTVTNARYGVMPSWGTRLDPVTVKMLATYVHSLGGGEEAPAPAAAPAAAK